jgi:hypothetical protein
VVFKGLIAHFQATNEDQDIGLYPYAPGTGSLKCNILTNSAGFGKKHNSQYAIMKSEKSELRFFDTLE